MKTMVESLANSGEMVPDRKELPRFLLAPQAHCTRIQPARLEGEHAPGCLQQVPSCAAPPGWD